MSRAALLALAIGATLVAPDRTVSDLQPDLHALVVRDLKFSAGEVADLEQGRIVRHTLPATAPGEVAAVGAVRIHASKARFAAAYRDMKRPGKARAAQKRARELRRRGK